MPVEVAEESHWPKKSRTSPSARGSASMRVTCAESTVGLWSASEAASARSVSSGIVLHSEYDRRDASSYDVSGWTRVGSAAGSSSMR